MREDRQINRVNPVVPLDVLDQRLATLLVAGVDQDHRLREGARAREPDRDRVAGIFAVTDRQKVHFVHAYATSAPEAADGRGSCCSVVHDHNSEIERQTPRTERTHKTAH